MTSAALNEITNWLTYYSANLKGTEVVEEILIH
jgi:Zn/Cd-binding protein ZinT